MKEAFDAMWNLYKDGRTARSAAYAVALERIEEALLAGGDRAYFANGGS
jgi:glutamate dehydrogenase/leucine dehydrogenase